MARQFDPFLLVLLGLGGYWLYTRQTAQPVSARPVPAPRMLPTPRMEPASSNSYNKWIQTSLNRLMGCGLAVDGIIGPLTRACTKRFQEMWGISPTGSVDTETDYYMRSALGQPGYIEKPFGEPVPSGEVWY